MDSIAERLARRHSHGTRINYNETQLSKQIYTSSSETEYEADESSDDPPPRKTRKFADYGTNIKTRDQKRKNYNEDEEEEEEEEETSETSEDSEEDYSSDIDEEEEEDYDDEDELIVEEIIGKRDNNKSLKKKVCDADDDTDKKEEVDEYYVKFRDRAYIHCQWLTADQIKELEDGEKKLKSFNRQCISDELSPSISIDNLLTFEDKELNTVWFKIDRIIDDRGDEETGTEFLVKWQSLDYDKSTWEKKEDIREPNKIDEYYERLKNSNATHIPTRWKRPSPDKFKKIEEPPEADNGDTLRSYQLEGLNWLRLKWYNKMNNILADEMGLGKTAQIVSMLNDLSINEGINGPFLVIAPLSTLPHWHDEFEKWSSLNAVVYHGNDEARDLIRKTEFDVYKKGRKVPNRVQFDVIVTNYETLNMEFNRFDKIEWRYVVFDEAHKLKNPEGKLYKKVETLVFEHCTMLTGTPIQNNIEELWGLLHLLHPDRFDDLEDFKEEYGSKEEDLQVDQVHKIQAIIKPLMLRRKKSDVEKSIAPKEETIVAIELTRTQKKYYKAFLSDNRDTLLSKITGGACVSLKNLMMQLRKVCNHPYLIKNVEETVLKEKREDPANKDLTDEELELQSMIMASGKLVFIDKLLPKLKEGNHKVLIFSQMVRVLTIIERFLIARGYKYERLDGSVSENDRATSIDRFNQDPDEFVFLLSTKAGGVGINLTAADTVIIYDSDWNPQNDIQAEARCHRIGQTQKVKVYRLITRGTYESKMFTRASKKLGLDHVVLDGGDMNKNNKMKANEMEQILRNGVASIFNDDDSKADEFTSEDIDQILSRRAKVTTTDVITGGDSIFAKASFNADGDDLDINSNDFWSQVLPTYDDTGDVPTMRRCRKNRIEMEAAAGVTQDNDITKAIRHLISNGYTNEIAAETIVLREAFHGDLRDSSDKEALDLITKDFPHGDQTETEKFLGEFGYNIEQNRKKICERVAFFYRLRRALFFAQDENVQWPLIKPPWEDPFVEYALMVGVNKYHINNREDMFNDEELGLKDAEQLSKDRMVKRVRNLFEGIEKQYKDHLNDEIPPDFTPLPPKEWQEKHQSLLERKTLYDTEVLTLIQAVSSFGMPKKGGIEKLREESKISHVTGKAFQEICNEIKALCESFAKEEEAQKLKEKEEKAKEGEKAKEDEEKKEERRNERRHTRSDEKEFLKAEKEKEKEKLREKEREKEKERVDLTNYPLLKPINGKLTKKEVKKIQTSIDDMNTIIKFIKNLDDQRIELMKKAPKYEKSPEWWDWECDKALIENLAKYGFNSCSLWIIDPNGPFRAHIKEELIPGFEEAAENEKQKGKAIKPDALEDELVILYNQRSRVSRAINVISSIKKELHKEKRQKEREEKAEKKKERKERKLAKDGSTLRINSELKIANFGTIVNNKGFVKKSIVYPLGFVSERKYRLTTSKAEKKWYRCQIVSKDNADPPVSPWFVVTSMENEAKRYESDDPTTAWHLLADELAKESGDKVPILKGASLFGLTIKGVKDELAKLPGASTLEYFMKKPETIEFTIPLKLLPKEEK